MQTLEELEALVAAKRTRINELRDDAEKRERLKRLEARPFLADGRRISVFMLVDPMAGFDRTTDDEYDSIEEAFRKAFKNDFEFRRDVHPRRLEGEVPDIYVMDFGGMIGVGCDGMTDDVYRGLRQQIDDHPNTVFVLWSSFTEQFYMNLMVEEYGSMDNDAARRHNVVFARNHDLARVLAGKL